MQIRLCAFSDEAGSSLSEQIAALKENNIYLTELRTVNGEGIASFTDNIAKEYNSELKNNGIKVFSLGSPLGKSDILGDFAACEKTLERLVSLCKIFGTDKIRMFSFFTKSPDDVRDEVLSRLNKLTTKAKAAGITLYHENEKGIYGDTATRVADLIENVSDLGLIFDPANFIQCGQDINEAIKMLLSRTDYIHIKDALYDTGAVVPAGMGEGQIERIINLIDRDITLTVEPHLRVFAGYNNIDDTELKNKFVYKTGREAFGAAADALKKILVNCGYSEENKKWIK